MSVESKFGINFQPLDKNRLDILDEQKPVPQATTTGRETRALLKKEISQKDWPPLPEDVTSVEHFFEMANQKVSSVWNERVSGKLQDLTASWCAAIPRNEKTEPLLKVLQDPATLETKLSIHQFGILEPLRNVLPEAWSTLVQLASERQLAAVALTRHWLNEIPASERQAWAQHAGLDSFAEVDLLVNTSELFGKFIDQAYLKQIELADAPHGQEQSPLAEKAALDPTKVSANFHQGLKYIYDLATPEGQVDVKSYSEIFPFEWPRLTAGMHRLGDKVTKLLATGALDKKYAQLPAYLHLCADTYGSPSKDPHEVATQWQLLLRNFHKLMLDGCPLMLVPQATPAVADAATKADVELRLGFRTRESLVLEKELQPFYDSVKAISVEETPFLEKPFVPPAIFSNHQPFAFGPNLYWMTRGEEGVEKIVTHTNAVRDVARTTALPALQKVFEGDLDEEAYAKATVVDNSLHEWGHMILPKEDSAVRARIGATPETDMAEEIKADSGNMKIVHRTLENGAPLDVHTQLQAKLADLCDYLANKSSALGTSGERYFMTGVAILSELLEKGFVVPSGDRYKIIDDRATVAAIAQFHDRFLDLYRQGSPVKLAIFIDGIRAKATQEPMASFIKKIRA